MTTAARGEVLPKMRTHMRTCLKVFASRVCELECDAQHKNRDLSSFCGLPLAAFVANDVARIFHLDRSGTSEA
jgi:hypothetical protein